MVELFSRVIKQRVVSADELFVIFSREDRTVILIVDDSAFSRKATRNTLEKLGFQIEEASDGEAALVKLGQTHYDCVLTDLLMPGMSGLDLLDRIRSVMEIPVIVVTSDIQTTTLQLCMDKGAVTVVNKPVDASKLSQALALALPERVRT